MGKFPKSTLRRRRLLTAEALEARLLLSRDFTSAIMSEFVRPWECNHDDCNCCGNGESHFLFTDSSGSFHFDPAPELSDPIAFTQPETFDSDSPPVVSATLPLFHSNPEASKTIFLDFDGHVVESTAWNTNFNDNLAIHAVPFSLDEDVATFSLEELSHIDEIYQQVAEDFSPFDVNVTTEDPGTEVFAEGSQAIRVLISTDYDDASIGGTGNRWFSDAGGVAYVNSWGWNSDTPVWVFENNLGSSAKTIAEAASHEIGHALNLNHDGDDGASYYRGHGAGATGWAPIMGIGYDRELTQWSRGEYENADNDEDDLAQISQRLGYRVDADSDAPLLAAAATQLVPSGTTSVNLSRVIEQTSDIDVFRIDAYGETLVDLQFTPAEISPNLDIEIQVFDSSGTVLATSNPIGALHASYSATLPPGVYTVAVAGVGQGDLTSGYSDYGSIGQYFISGIVDSADPVVGGPVAGVAGEFVDNPLAPTDITLTFNQPIDQTSFDLDDVVSFVAPDGSTPLMTGYHFPAANLLRIEFEQLAQTGTYSMELGPEIYDLDGLAMDQNQNSVVGEPSDTYAFEIFLTPDSTPHFGPRVLGLPTVDSTVATSTLTLQFDQLLDQDSFDLSDVVAFSGPDGNNRLNDLIGFSFPTADQITLEFRPQTVPGFYLAIIGPQIFDLEGFPMDQNGDGQAGGFGDSYTAFFEVTERQSTITGDFNDDQIVDAIDVDLICSALNASNHGTAFDLNSDGIVDVSDMDEMIFNVVGTIYGDINLDRVVDTTDFNIWNANKFQSGTHWSSGDLTCDSFTDVSDFNVWSSRKFQSAVPALTPVETPQRATNDALIGVSPATPVPSKTMSNRLRSTDRIWSIFGA